MTTQPNPNQSTLQIHMLIYTSTDSHTGIRRLGFSCHYPQTRILMSVFADSDSHISIRRHESVYRLYSSGNNYIRQLELPWRLL